MNVEMWMKLMVRLKIGDGDMNFGVNGVSWRIRLSVYPFGRKCPFRRFRIGDGDG